MPFKPGDWIKHAAFGSGLITEEKDSYLVIRFVDSGEKSLKASFVTEPGFPPYPGFAFTALKRPKALSSTSKARASLAPTLSFAHLLEAFLSVYPAGFEDPAFQADEREYKNTAIENFRKILSEEEMSSQLAGHHFAEIARRARQSASGKMNLIFPQELMSLNDALKSAASQEAFARGLFDVLYGPGEKQERFNRYIQMLGSIGCLKWTVATYFQFLATDGEAMFMKPMVSKALAASLSVDLLYAAEPNWLTYERLSEVAILVQQRLEAAGLKPHNRVDVQSFMYVACQRTK